MATKTVVFVVLLVLAIGLATCKDSKDVPSAADVSSQLSDALKKPGNAAPASAASGGVAYGSPVQSSYPRPTITIYQPNDYYCYCDLGSFYYQCCCANCRIPRCVRSYIAC